MKSYNHFICKFYIYYLHFQQADKDLMDLALKDVRTASCRVLREPKPFECKDYNGAGSIVATFGLVSACAVFAAILKMF